MMKHTIDMYITRGQMCDAMQKEIDNLEAELADAKQANSYNADVMMQMADEISELRKDNKCASCTNRGKADGLTQETYCDSCIYAEPWRKDNYNAMKGGECELFL